MIRRGRAFDDLHPLVSNAYRPIAGSEGSCCALYGEQELALVRVGRRLFPQSCERFVVEVVQPWAAVDQHRLAEHATHAVLGGEHAAVAPLV